MSDDSLKVPFAVDSTGQKISPSAAVPGGEYFCPDCGSALVFRRAGQKVAHFAHKVIPIHCDFLYETEEHLRAKERVVRAIENADPIQLIRKCSKCGAQILQRVPNKARYATTEYLLPSGHRADVALLDENRKLLAVIEVYVTHEVEEEKAKALAGIPWAEFQADVILSSNDWLARKDRFRPGKCERCRDLERFGKHQPFAGEHKTKVRCVLAGRDTADVIEDCASCDHFYSADSHGITCLGMKVHGTG